MKETLRMALCEGRHEIPEAKDGAIFPMEIVNVTDVAALEDRAFAAIQNAATDLSELHIDLYVTGLTVALIATLNVCHDEGISITLWHYDRDNSRYYPQKVR